MSLTRYDLIEKRAYSVMEHRKNGDWVDADEALRAVSDARVAGQRMAMDEVRGWIDKMRVGAGNSGWMAALDEMEIHVESAWDRLENGEPIAGTIGCGVSDGGDQ